VYQSCIPAVSANTAAIEEAYRRHGRGYGFGFITKLAGEVPGNEKDVRTTDAKEVGVGNPAEETYRCPNAG
jgi:hypothetical protein